MATQADVENALAAIVANILYPNGTATASVLGNTCCVYRGLPAAPSLDAALASDILHATITPSATASKNVTRYPRQWNTVSPVAYSLLVNVWNQTATFSGSCLVGQLAGITFNEFIFAYALQSNDSPATVASNLATLLRSSSYIVEYSGTSITVPAAANFSVRIVQGAGALLETKRQMKEFKISLWCGNPTQRDRASGLIEQAVSDMNFIYLADGSSARIIYVGAETSDMAANAALYRKDILYSVEYPTTIAQILPAMLFGTTIVRGEYSINHHL
jgi:hypothetical protein